MKLTFSLLAVLVATCAGRVSAQTFSYLDDDAEAGGYDVTAQLNGTQAALSLAEAANGDGYRLQIGADLIELGARVGQKTSRLALVHLKVVPGAVVVQRRGPRWRVIDGGRVVLEAEDDRWREGKIGYSGALAEVRVQPTDDINFADDFMRDAKALLVSKASAGADAAEAIWSALAGSWSTSGLTENEAARVSQTANPFVFKTTAAGINLAQAGRPYWSDYSAEVSVKPEGAGAIGLAVYVQDAKNYLLLHWTKGSEDGAPQDGKAQGTMQLQAVIDGHTRVLDEAPGGFIQGQWYRLKVAAAAGTLRAFIDDNEVLRARTGLLGRGGVGLFADAAGNDAGASFDDVVVYAENDFIDDFSRAVPGRWQTVTGKWSMRNAAVPSGKQGAFAVMGEGDWTNYVVSARIALPADAAAGLVLHHQSGQGAYWLRLAGSRARLPYAGKAQIVKLAGGKATVLGETALGARYNNKSLTLSFSAESGYLRANADDKLVVDAWDEGGGKGRAGIAAQAGAKSAPRITDFEVSFPRKKPTWAKVPDLYAEGQQPLTMGGWSRPEGFWLTNSQRTSALVEQGSAPPQPGETLWHKGRFWGDDSVGFTLPAIAPGKSLDLLFAPVVAKNGEAGGDGAAKHGVLKLSFKLSAEGVSADLTKDDATPIAHGQSAIAGAPTAQTIEVERRGTFIIVRINGKDEPQRTLLAARVR